LFTDGAKYVADTAGAYGLVDAIALMPRDQRVAATAFQVWVLVVRPDRTATLACDDSDGRIVLTKELDYTDCPLEDITLYGTNNVIYLMIQSMDTHSTPSTPPPSILDRLLAPVGDCLTPDVARHLVDLHASADVQARLEELADKCTEGQLSAEERAEYETAVAAIEFIRVLQAKARRLLRQTPA